MAAAALAVGGALVAFAGGAKLTAMLFPVGALVASVALLKKKESVAYVELVVWLWLLAPELRRVVDFKAGWASVSPVMLAAPLATLPCILPALGGVRRLHPDVARAFVAFLAAVGFGFLVGLVKNGLAPPAAALRYWLAPVSLGLYVANAAPDVQALRRAVGRLALWGALVLGLYGIVQFFVLPGWDRYWMQHVPMNSIGAPNPMEVRVFSLVNSTGPFGTVIGCLLIVLAGVRSRLRVVAAATGFVAFALSLVRAAWLGFLVAAVLLLVRGRSSALRAGVIAVGIPILLFVSVGGPAKTVVVERLGQTIERPRRDESFTDRVRFHRQTLPKVARDVVGAGLGSIGVSTKLFNASGKLPADSGNFDGGALEILFLFGVGVGGLTLVLLVSAVAASWRRARAGSDFERACAAALVGLVAQLPFASPLTSVAGVCFWLLLGLQAPQGDPVDQAEQAEGEGGSGEP